MKQAKVWWSYERLGKLIDDEGPWAKALASIREKGQLGSNPSVALASSSRGPLHRSGNNRAKNSASRRNSPS